MIYLNISTFSDALISFKMINLDTIWPAESKSVVRFSISITILEKNAILKDFSNF